MLPNFPTDNLYKFMALSGLALAFGCLVIFIQISKNKENKKAIVSAETFIGDRLKEDVDIYAKLGQETSSNELKSYALEKLEKAYPEYFAQNTKNAKAKSELVAAQRKIRVRFAISGIIIGLILSLSGFILWYFRVQRHLDRILLAELRKTQVQSYTQ